MRRLVLLSFVLFGSGVHAHAVAFDFIDPDGAGQRTDAGFYTLSWLDGPDPAGSTLVRFHATRPALLPWGKPDGGVTVDITPGAVAIADNANAYQWDATQVAEGCWQPWATMSDPIEGVSTIPARGLITVVNGANVPPSVWVTNPVGAVPSDAGIFSLTFFVDDPDDATLVTLEAQQSSGAVRRLATDLPFTAGGGAGSFPVDVAPLGGGAWFLHAMVRNADGGSCDAWWPGTLYLSGTDGGVDAGAPDSGSGGGAGGSGGAGGGGGGGQPPGGCGCSSSGSLGLLVLLALSFTLSGRRRPKSNG